MWLVNYIYYQGYKKQCVVLKIKLWVYLKQTQQKIIVNQHLPKMCMLVETNETKSNKTIIREHN